MKKIIIFLLLPLYLFSFNFKSEFLKGNYSAVCKKGMNKYYNGERDENFLSLVGIACVKIDSFNPISLLLINLKKTKDGRNNALYFANLIFQKKLLYSYMLDNIDISYYKTADTTNILSIVINKLANKDFTKTADYILIKDKYSTYRVYLSGTKVYIDKYIESNLIERHWYR